ncbi:MAG: hypothetical protein CFE43_21090 [Burkholderiales bacterium PBB3]|nr:MAG: hypothetical protein CFE43_21090 [Burkholderiales bacterium PBB3]
MRWALYGAVALFLMASVAIQVTQPTDVTTQAQLDQMLRQRYLGDNSGVCVLAAVVQPAGVVRSRMCAKPRPEGEPPWDAAFEIGSITKTMTAFLVADLIESGKWSLDDPLAMHLPPGTQVPRQGERQILLRDVVTHRSGLPRTPSLPATDPEKPFASLTEADLLAWLSDMRLREPIGTRFEYSNFAMMLLSLAVAHAYGTDFETALRSHLFAPLNMRGASINQPPPGQPQATGHHRYGDTVPATIFPTNLAGVGGVRATLDDMVKYVQAEIRLDNTPVGVRMRRTQQKLTSDFAMNWMVYQDEGRQLVLHDGGTVGFTSMVVVDPVKQRGVVILSDVGAHEIHETLEEFALALVGARGIVLPLPEDQRDVPPELSAALVGDYDLAGLPVHVWDAKGRLMVQARGQPAHEYRLESRGDSNLYNVDNGMKLTVLYNEPFTNLRRKAAGFRVHQWNGRVEAVRKGSEPQLSARNPQWQPWAGEYWFDPDFGLRVFEHYVLLKAQVTAQPAYDVEVTGSDQIEIKRLGAVVRFNRDDKGQVVSATLTQNGRVLQGLKR